MNVIINQQATTLPAHATVQDALATLAARLDLPLWRIGYTVAASDERPAGDILLTDADGKPLPLPAKGFDHFG